MKIKYYGHACYALENQGTTLIFDPFLNDNPLADIKADSIKADYILLTHGHFDHVGDALEIAQKNNAQIITTVELAASLEQPGVNFHRMNLGGSFQFPFGRVKMTPALHGSGVAGGRACGFVIDFFGQIVYFAGDTGLFGDMKLIGELHPLDLAILPIGDNFTMGISDAVIAAKFLQAKKVIPMHYNTWDLIQAEPEVFKTQVEKTTDSICLIVEPGKEIEL